MLVKPDRRRRQSFRRPFTLGLTKGVSDGYADFQIGLFKADHLCDSSPGQFFMKPRCFIHANGFGSFKKE